MIPCRPVVVLCIQGASVCTNGYVLEAEWTGLEVEAQDWEVETRVGG